METLEKSLFRVNPNDLDAIAKHESYQSHEARTIEHAAFLIMRLQQKVKKDADS